MLKCQNILLKTILLLIFVNNMLANPSDTSPHELLATNSIPSRDHVSNNKYSSNPSQVESRGWKKTAVPFLLGVVLKMTTLLPMISSLMTVIGGVALVASKLALILSVGIAVHYYLAMKHQMQYYRQPVSHSGIYDPVVPVTPYPLSHRLSVQST